MTSKHEQGIEVAAKAIGVVKTYEDQQRAARAAVSAYLSVVLDETELAEVICPREASTCKECGTQARAVISHLRGGNDE